MNNAKDINPRMTNPDGMYASDARSEDCFTLKDHYAGLAMQYFIDANNGNFSQSDAKQAFYIAETMLEFRDENKDLAQLETQADNN